MSITDELREYASMFKGSATHARLDMIADRIDAEYKRMYADLTVGMEPMTEENMAERGWVKLPVDADGETIHIGDVLEGYRKTIKIVELRNSGTWHLVDEFGNEWHDHEAFVHAQPDSWERIIKDAGELGYDWYSTPMGDNVYAEKIGKLVERCKRLAGEDA